MQPLLVLRVGDRYRYCSPSGAMAITCRSKDLEVLDTRMNELGAQEVEVKASGWCTRFATSNGTEN